MEGITFSSDKGGVTLKDLVQTSKLSEMYFKTNLDPSQFQVTKANTLYVFRYLKKFINIIKCNKKIIGFTFMLPCNKKLMNAFVNKKISENQLFDGIKKSVNPKKFEALYFCASFIKPKFRRKGLATEARMKSIKKLLKGKKIKPILFCWPYSAEGKRFGLKVARLTGFKIIFRT